MSGLSSRKLILVTFIILSVVLAVALYFLVQFIPEDKNWLLLLIIPALFLGFGIPIIYGVMNKHVFDRIRKIYRAIEMSKKEHQLIKDSRKGIDVISRAESDVNSWAKEKTDEIALLRETDSYRREFIGNLAHELKTPIFSIQGYILTLLEGGALEDPKANKKFLKKASKGVDRLVSLVEDLDSVAKIESGVFTPELSNFNITLLANEVIESMEQSAGKHDIRLSLESPGTTVIGVRADRKRIEQVLTNLISNSISYGNKGGETRVEIIEEDDQVIIKVKDNGIGINEENVARIFERFYRVDKSRSRQHGGSGLGLSIVKHIIEAHDQQITVQSVEGQGSAFAFTLDRAI